MSETEPQPQPQEPPRYDWFDRNRMMLRPSDRTYFDLCLATVTREGKSLALISDNEVALDHYARLLLSKLRESDDIDLETYFPSSTEWLINRFNEILSDLTIVQATGREPASRARILSINDASSVTHQESQLLARLVADFPGANLRVMMVILEREGVDPTEIIGPFGRRMLYWRIEAPTAEEAKLMLAAARAQACEADAIALLRQFGLVDQLELSESHTFAPPDKSRPDAENPSESAAPATRRRRWEWLVLLLAVCLAAFVWRSELLEFFERFETPTVIDAPPPAQPELDASTAQDDATAATEGPAILEPGADWPIDEASAEDPVAGGHQGLQVPSGRSTGLVVP